MNFIPAKTILSGYSADNKWFGMNYNMNIYKGCSHGCIYCDSRSDCYRIENFDTIRAKDNALSIIESELKSKKKKGVVGSGAMSDPYNPLEKSLKLTEGALRLIDKYRFGVGIATKSDLIARDVDIFCQIKKHSPVIVKITITSFDDAVSSIIEPHVARSSARFAALKELSDKGIFAGVLLMPLLPNITDSEENLLRVVHQAANSGAKYIMAGFGVTLRGNQRDWYYSKLDKHFPNLKERYIKSYGESYSCDSKHKKQLYSLLKSECQKLGLIYNMQDIISAYKEGYGEPEWAKFM